MWAKYGVYVVNSCLINSLRPSDAYMSVNYIIIGLDNGPLPDPRQVIVWTNAGILLIGPLGTSFIQNLNRNLCIFIQENAFENVIWQMTAILSWPQYVNLPLQMTCYM